MAQHGYSSVGALVVVFILSFGTLMLAFFASALIKYSDAYRRHYDKQEIALSVLDRLTESMQLLVNDECDNDYSSNRCNVIDLYSDYDLALDDISSRINIRFLHESIAENQDIAGLISLKGDEIETDYGWVSMYFSSQKILDAVHSSFSSDSLFPLINRFPIFNLFYTDPDLLTALLKAVKIKDAADKSVLLNSRVQSGSLSDSEISRILGVKESSKELDLFGVKTSFWRAKFHAGDCSVTAIYAAIPNDENARTVERYVLIEKELNF